VNRIERFVLKYDVEGFIITSIAIVGLFVVIALYILSPDYELKRMLFYLILGTPLLVLSLYRLYKDKLNSYPKENDIYISLLCGTFLILLFNIDKIQSNSVLSNYVLFLFNISVILLFFLFISIEYRIYLNYVFEGKLSKTKRLFLKYDTELFVIGLIVFTVSYSLVFYSDGDYGNDSIISLFVSCLVSMPILYVAISDSLRGAKIICTFYTSIVTPILLFLIIYEFTSYEFTSYEGGLEKHILYIVAKMLLIILNITVYRSYLNIKYRYIKGFTNVSVKLPST
jgi:hypothetical protein